MRTTGSYFKQPRHLFQWVVLVITLGLGLQFYVHVRQALGDGAITVQRPPGVEGFLPIGALMGWKQFVLTRRWDVVHPAAMVIFGWAVVISFIFRKAFCGWFCPVGTVSEWCWRIGLAVFGANPKLPAWLDNLLRVLKYFLLGFFLWIIFMMSADQISTFMHSPYYKLSDVKMLYFFTKMSGLTAAVLAGLLSLSLFFKNFWCRYLCPYGALLGLVAMVGPTRIQRVEASCIDCGCCDRACPSRLPVSRKGVIHSPECIGCLDCVEACPVEQTLVLSSVGIHQRFWSARRAGLFIALFFVLTLYLASITGYWRSGVSDQEFRMRLVTIDAPQNTHPAVDLGRVPD
jgi:ferredoxin